MSDLQDFFVTHARLSRKTLARFAELDVSEIDRAAEDLGFGALLRLDEAEEILAELDADGAVEEDDDDPADEGDDDEPQPEEDT